MNSASLAFEDIMMSCDLLKHRSACLFQKVEDQLEGPPRLDLDRKMDIPTDTHRPFSSNTNFRRSSATYHPPHSGPLLFSNTIFFAILPSPIGVEGVPPIFFTVFHPLALFQSPSATASLLLDTFCPHVQG